MPLTKRSNSIKAGRKWKRCGKTIKHIKLVDGCSNKRPIRKLKEYIRDYLINND